VSVDGAIEFLDLFIEGRPSFNFFDIWLPHDADLRVAENRNHTPTGMCSLETLFLEGVAMRCAVSMNTARSNDQDTQGRVQCIYTREGDRFDVDLTYDLPNCRPTNFWLIPAFVRTVDEHSLKYLCLMVRSIKTDVVGPGSAIFERIGAGYVFDVHRVSLYKRRVLVLI
jgi:hypothetical protein